MVGYPGYAILTTLLPARAKLGCQIEARRMRQIVFGKKRFKIQKLTVTATENLCITEEVGQGRRFLGR